MTINKDNILQEVYILSEAASLWGKDESTLRRSLRKFIKGSEYRKAGRITLITKAGMERVYGEPKI